jgi:hypothetical protein
MLNSPVDKFSTDVCWKLQFYVKTLTLTFGEHIKHASREMHFSVYVFDYSTSAVGSGNEY